MSWIDLVPDVASIVATFGIFPPQGLVSADYGLLAGPVGDAYPMTKALLLGRAFDPAAYQLEWQSMDPVSKTLLAKLVARIGARVACGLPRHQHQSPDLQTEADLWQRCKAKTDKGWHAAREEARRREQMSFPWAWVVGGTAALGTMIYLGTQRTRRR